VQRWYGLDAVPAGFGPSAVTIGNFDGVHLGHQAVLRGVVERARQLDATPVAVTFDPHPLAVLFPDRAPQPLSTLEHRLELLAGMGLGAVVVMRFDRELAQWSPERFVQEVLVDALGAQAVVVRDTRFGHRNSGDVQTLRELGARLGFDVEVVADVGDEDRWSSTRVRRLVEQGDVETVAEVLGHPHRTTGEVVHGDHRGRTLGYPTANLSPDAVGAVPADGIYAGWLIDYGREERSGAPGARRLPAAISVGTNPTFGGIGRRVEAYVLDRDDLQLYGHIVAVEFVRRLRATLLFDSVEQLLERMAADVEQCREVLGAASAP
jgi:riboflavin kinase/FMN adenylyltransferase